MMEAFLKTVWKFFGQHAKKKELVTSFCLWLFNPNFNVSFGILFKITPIAVELHYLGVARPPVGPLFFLTAAYTLYSYKTYT